MAGGGGAGSRWESGEVVEAVVGPEPQSDMSGRRTGTWAGGPVRTGWEGAEAALTTDCLRAERWKTSCSSSIAFATFAVAPWKSKSLPVV